MEEKTKSIFSKFSILEMEREINESDERAIKEIEAALKENISNRAKLAFIKARVLGAENQSISVSAFTYVSKD